MSAEQFAKPVAARLGAVFKRANDLGQLFDIRWGQLEFEVFYGVQANLKVILKVHREHGVCERYFVDTEPSHGRWNYHRRHTRDFFLLPVSSSFGAIRRVEFSFIVHLHGRSIPSEFDYLLLEQRTVLDDGGQQPVPAPLPTAPNAYRTYELDAAELQADVDWYNHHFEALRLVPKFTKGQVNHPYHPKRYIHDHIDKVIRSKWAEPGRLCTIKVSVDCIDDGDFINHLVHASQHGVLVQCIVDWRKMTLTHSPHYARLKRARLELLGVFCTPKHHLIEVEPDMHTKFIIFNDEDCITGSFNITFDRWWANWESGMTFHSKGVCRLFDNIFQSQRGGVIQQYGIDPLSHFNLLYTFGRHVMGNGQVFKPHQAILSEIHRACHSIKLCLFLMGDLLGDHHDSVVDALIHAHRRGVAVHILFNGHLARLGKVGVERPMAEELERPLLPAVRRLKAAGVRTSLVYAQDDHPVPYSPIHSKYCIIDGYIVLDGSFNWYNTSVFSHDLLVVAANHEVARPYLYEFEQIQRCFRLYD